MPTSPAILLELTKELNIDIPAMEGDISQLRQVVMNLIINASEALSNVQGEIIVAVTKTKITSGQSDKDHQGNSLPSGWYNRLVVTDSGCGMADETMNRISDQTGEE